MLLARVTGTVVATRKDERLVSSTLLGGMLSMFEMRSEETAMARASLETQPSTDGLAVRKVDSRPRG